jgi:hypothetical protein
MHLPASLDTLVTINEESGLVLRCLSTGQLHRSVSLGIAPSYAMIVRSGFALVFTLRLDVTPLPTPIRCLTKNPAPLLHFDHRLAAAQVLPRTADRPQLSTLSQMDRPLHRLPHLKYTSLDRVKQQLIQTSNSEGHRTVEIYFRSLLGMEHLLDPSEHNRIAFATVSSPFSSLGLFGFLYIPSDIP